MAETAITQELIEDDTDSFLLNSSPLDYRELKYDSFLSNLQGNILKGHGRDNTSHIFVRFPEGKIDMVKDWVRRFATEKITSFKEQVRQREIYKRNRVPGGLFSAIYFTSSFYKYLGLDLDIFGSATAFVDGMKSRKDHLFDDHSHWDESYTGEIHAMILLAHDDATVLGSNTHDLLEELEKNFKSDDIKTPVVDIEYGNAIRNASGDGLEHFGYVDGISQPLFLKDEIDEYGNANVRDDQGKLRFDPLAQLDLVLVKDPFTKDTQQAYGSYFVYRKLEQDVRGFKEAEDKIARHKLPDGLELSEDDLERAGAMIVGRFEDGTPVTLSGTDKMISSGIMNNFNYKEIIGGKDDSMGGRCPFHAHIRKSNPRRNDSDKRRIMARRGITYGHRNVSTTIEQTFVQMPKTGVGLLFMSFQKSIEEQFEFIQRSWINNPDFPEARTCVDVVIGQTQAGLDNRTALRTGNYARVYNDNSSFTKVSFENFVTLKGGEYFFAPSVCFLKTLGTNVF